MELLPLIARGDGKGGVKVTLPKSARTDLCVMRQLQHRVVDMMADHGLVASLAYDADRNLTLLDRLSGDSISVY